MTAEPDRGLTEAALYAHLHLDDSLSLAALAQVAGLSEYHFHRKFRERFGEAPAAYVRRLRLERAAWRLYLHDDSILSIALDCGFNDHETFSRAFRRRYGMPPRAYREAGRLPAGARRDRSHDEPTGDYVLSPIRVRTLSAKTIAFIRHTGPYEEVDPNLWKELEAWAERAGVPAERALIGIGHDAPGITAPENLRFDAAMTVPPGTTGKGRIMVGRIPAYRCAVATHVGPYSSLPDAYPRIFAGAMAAAPALMGLPAIEVYDDHTIETQRAVSRTEVHLPIAPA